MMLKFLMCAASIFQRADLITQDMFRHWSTEKYPWD